MTPAFTRTTRGGWLLATADRQRVTVDPVRAGDGSRRYVVRINGSAAESPARALRLADAKRAARAAFEALQTAPGPATARVLRRQALKAAMAPGPSLVRRIDPATGAVLGTLDPYDPARNPFRTPKGRQAPGMPRRKDA